MNGEIWSEMRSAPKDGTPIRIAVHGRKNWGEGRLQMHELPYDVMWHGGRWCYARNGAPLFNWHVPRFWKPVVEKVAA